MKAVAVATAILLLGIVLIDVVAEADLVPSGVRAVMEEVASVW